MKRWWCAVVALVAALGCQSSMRQGPGPVGTGGEPGTGGQETGGQTGTGGQTSGTGGRMAGTGGQTGGGGRDAGASGGAGGPVDAAPPPDAAIRRDLAPDRASCSDATLYACLPCGKAGEPCCKTGLPCDPGTLCQSSANNEICAACGLPGERCCPDQLCEAGGCCTGLSCVADGAICAQEGNAITYGMCKAGKCQCGELGQPCCQGSSCRDDKTVCKGPDGGTCVACGDRSGPCCQKGTICRDPSTACEYHLTRICQDCGATGFPCCANKTCKSAGDVCAEDVCRTCGVPGGPCCPGDTCLGGGCCSGGSCVANGARCNLNSNTCTQGKCGCGQPGQACCFPNDGPTCADQSTFCTDTPERTKTSCVPCGTVGAPCCRGSRCAAGACCAHLADDSAANVCVAQGASCGAPGLVCGAGGSCSPTCGGVGQDCCKQLNLYNGFCTAPGTHCLFVPSNYHRCLRCGGAGEPCCPGTSESPEAKPTDLCNAGLHCSATLPATCS
jgi:hypothetical protein